MSASLFLGHYLIDGVCVACGSTADELMGVIMGLYRRRLDDQLVLFTIDEETGDMTVGPFDDVAPLPPSEYDGDSGLVQPEAKGHTPTPAERLGMVNRLDGTTSVDPVTGVVQPKDD